MSKITRKASSNKFGSWKEKGGGIFSSRKDVSTPTGEEETHDSTEQLGKSLETVSTTPSTEDKGKSRSSLGSWNFMRKNKKGGREDLTASEISETSERASVSEIGDGDEDTHV